jgi:alanyl-tRNA synthetase
MKKSQKQMIREMSHIVTEDVIKMIEDVEAVQKKAEKADRKARAKKREKALKKMLKRERKQDDAVDAIRYSSLPLDEVDDDFLGRAMDDLAPADDDFIDISNIRLV